MGDVHLWSRTAARGTLRVQFDPARKDEVRAILAAHEVEIIS
jgi:hypothetical protein